MPRITAVRAIPVVLDGHEPYLGAQPGGSPPGYFLRPPWRSLYSARFESLLVQITCDNGVVGWGEALAPVAPQVPAAVVERLLAPLLVGADPRETAVLRRRLEDTMRERGHLGGHQADALAAVDIALWDLKGKLVGESVAGLLGGPFRTRIPAYVSGLAQRDDEGRADLARRYAAEGATAVKLALGYGVEADLATFDAVAAAAPDLRIAVDAHWAYDLAQAKRLGLGLDERRAWFLEAPLAPEDVEAHRDLARALITPVALGEALRHRWEFRPFIEARAVAILQPDVGRTGISEAIGVAEYARVHHLALAWHHSTGLGVALAAGLQMAAATESLVAFEYQPLTVPVGVRLLTEPVRTDAGGFDLPEGPGLGIDVDERAVEAASRGWGS